MIRVRLDLLPLAAVRTTSRGFRNSRVSRGLPTCLSPPPFASLRCCIGSSSPLHYLSSRRRHLVRSFMMTGSDTSIASLELQLQQLRVEAARLHEKARELRQQHAGAAEIDAAAAAVLAAREEIQHLEKQIQQQGGYQQPSFIKYRQQCENLIKRKFFVVPAYEIYGGSGGLFDLGPPGCGLKSQIEALWRSHFVLEEEMLEVSGPCLTPHVVLKTSGHVDRFTDLMVKDVVTQECFRADKYLEEVIEKEVRKVKENAQLEVSEKDAKIAELELIHRQADAYTAEELQRLFERFQVVSPHGNPLSAPFPFNLMRLYEFVGGRMPFAAAQLGIGFRNEIAPRNGLLRVREFPMAEIEHFCHPEKKNDFPKFVDVEEALLPLFPRERQLGCGVLLTDMPLRDAVAKGIVANKTLAYFLARTYSFLLKIGLQQKHIRFRQHLKTEMAHYASDCWDAEVETAYGWIEVAGHADRAAFDLSSHTRASKVDLVAMERFDPPLRLSVLKPIFNKQRIGAVFRQSQKAVVAAIEALSDKEKEAVEEQLETTGGGDKSNGANAEAYDLTREMVRFEAATQTVGERPYIPSVVEPSFGIGRILHCVLEHSFCSRGIEGQEERVFMRFPPLVAPTKVALLPLSNNAMFNPMLQQLRRQCVLQQLTVKVDTSGASIGRRYARVDELGTPFALTIDFQSLEDNGVTLRERDSMQQVRIPAAEAPARVSELCRGELLWKDILNRYPLVVVSEQ
ncbi:glycyl-tRNA synthetase [Cyclospora cayetanensis]|uniref:glycine--tRNA ligase n=1 Tax=Cyclospora cayetanensis TaxID=88456 RepID=A0A1D3D8Z7_9EIME|nr:glycyl-tRNA synthetase [Cyclospora cayetanensis]